MTEAVERLLTQHLDTWTAAVETKSAAGRGSSKKLKLVGIQKLRELILELAVRGQLVPQDENDEPASVLLERIAAEREWLVKKKKIKKPKRLPEISEDEERFELPAGWGKARFNEIIDQRYPISYGVLVPGADVADGVPLVRIGDLSIHNPETNPEKKISPIIDSKYERTRLEGGEILMAVVGSIGKLGVAPESWKGANIARALCRIRPSSFIYNKYILMILQSGFMQNSFIGNTRTLAQPTLNIGLIRETVTPIPPFQEQKRIVAKVDELMALCDVLEQEQESSISAHGVLVENLLAALTNAANQGEFKQAWARVAEHFDTLFTTEQSVEQLKQTILQLAVMGKLVEQDPTDEPASVLLERIAVEKKRLVAEKVIKKQKALPEISDKEKVFELPEGWAWCRLGDLALDSSAGWSPKCLPTPREAKKWGVLKVSAVTWGDYQPEENKELPSELEPRENCEVKDGDFLISRANTAELVARAVVVPDGSPTKLMMSDKIIRFKFADEISTEFINLVNNSNVSRNYYLTVAGGTSSSMKNVSREQVRNLVVSLPPLQEQIKVVERVEQLRMMFEGLTVQVAKSKVSQVLLANVLAGAVLK